MSLDGWTAYWQPGMTVTEAVRAMLTDKGKTHDFVPGPVYPANCGRCGYSRSSAWHNVVTTVTLCSDNDESRL